MTTESKFYTVRESFDEFSYTITGFVKNKEVINIVCDRRGWRISQSSVFPGDIQQAQYQQLCITHVFMKYTEKRYGEQLETFK